MASGLFSEQTCPRCGAKTRHDAVGCPVCGYWLRATNYLPILLIVIVAAVMDISLIVWRGDPRTAIAISASELPPTVVVSAPTSTAAPVAIVEAAPSATPLPPTRTPIPTPTMPATPTIVPTVVRTATATPTREPTSTATSTPTVALPTPTSEPASPASLADAATAYPTLAPFTGGGTGDDSTLPEATGTAAEPTVPPAPTATPEPTATATAVPSEGLVVMHNYIGAELVITVTSQDVVWATTFCVDAMGQTAVSLAPGRYTYTVSPAGKPDQHGDLLVAAGASLEVSVVG